MKLYKMILCFFVISLCLSLAACSGFPDDESSYPDLSISEPDISVPELSDPDISLPENIPDSGIETMSVDFNKIDALDSKAVSFGSGTRKTPDGKSESALIFKNKYSNYAADFILDEKGKIFLTFDEGYENGYTAKIVDILKEKNVSAVFFVTMHYAKNNPELIQRMIDEGHIIGNHTASHPSMPAVSLEKAAEEITSLHDYIKETYNYEMSLFRFPEGVFSEKTLALVESLNYRSVFWSFAYADWRKDSQPDPEATLKKLTDFTHDGAIYLLHAVSSTNAQILPDAINAIREKGYEFSKYPTDR